MLLLAIPRTAIGGSVPSEAPTIFFRTDRYLGAYTPGESGYRPIRSLPATARFEWMQLVPGARRIFWSEYRFAQPGVPAAWSYWSAKVDGSDIRPEPELGNAQLGPNGDWKYYFDPVARQFARSRLDGSEAHLLGFGQATLDPSSPYVDDDEEWLYYFGAELSPAPNVTYPRLAILRGHLRTGVVEERVVTAQAAWAARSSRLILDLGNDLMHAPAGCELVSDSCTFDYTLNQFDFSTGELIAWVAFWEEESQFPLFTTDPVNRDYYLMYPGGLESMPLRRASYDSLTKGEILSLGPESIVFYDAEIGVFRQLESHPSIHVPEADGALAALVAVGSAIGLARLRRRQFNRRLIMQSARIDTTSAPALCVR